MPPLAPMTTTWSTFRLPRRSFSSALLRALTGFEVAVILGLLHVASPPPGREGRRVYIFTRLGRWDAFAGGSARQYFSHLLQQRTFTKNFTSQSTFSKGHSTMAGALV